MTTKYTPGAWIYAMVEGTNYARITLDTTGKDSLRGYCGEDNARLIAAAPELLEALQQTLAQCLAWQGEPNEYSCEVHSKIIRQARAALAKATGEQE